MTLLKSKLLPLFGLMIVLAFIALSANNNNMYMDQLIVSGSILSVVCFFRLGELKHKK